MTVIRKRTGDKGGCCDPISELQLEIERVDQTAIDAKTTANNTEAHLSSIEGKVNEAIAVVPQVQTNTEAIAAHGTELTDHDARIHTNTIVNDQQNTDIANLKTKTNDSAAAIEALENEVGPETVAGTIQYRLKNIDTKLPTAIKEVEMIANASTVTHKATHISGTTESDALPIVSREQAGIMSASVYAAMEDVIANNTSRISVLEQSAPTYDISGLVGPNPTNAEISAAFTQKYPNVPIQAGLRAADYDNAHFWQYGNNTWILLTQIEVEIATNQSLGIVKGSNTDGKVFVETDGSMSLKGYDALVSKDATHDSKISTLETGLGNANARIDATNTNVANNAQDIIAANGNISTNTNDISGLKGRMATAEGQIATHETKIDQHTQSINGLSTDVNGLNTDVNGLKTDVNGLKERMTTAEGQIATHETKIDQHTQRINGLSTDVNGLKTDVNGLKTDVNGLKTDVNGLKTDINGLKTSKQDKLTAGTGITIDNNVISSQNVPIRRAVEGKNAMLEEFKKFLSQGEVGDTYEMMCRFPNTNNDWQNGYGPYAGNDSFFIFGSKNGDHMRITAATAMTVVNRTTWLSTDDITIAFYGKVDGRISGSSKNDTGVVYITNHNDNYTMRVYRYSNVASFAQYYVPGPVSLGLDSFTTLYDEKAYVNYAPKT